MTYVKLAHFHCSLYCHRTLESLSSYTSKKMIYFFASQLWEKDASRDIKQAISAVQPTLCPLRCVTDSVHCVISRPDFSTSIISLFAHDEPFAIHHDCSCARQPTHWPDAYSLWLSSDVRWLRRITFSQKHVELNSFDGFPVLSQKLLQVCGEVSGKR